MHVHVIQIRGVRTTVEISDAQRAALLKLAAERGEKGFSRLVGEALDRYLAELAALDEAALADSEGIAVAFLDGQSTNSSTGAMTLDPWNVSDNGAAVCGAAANEKPRVRTNTKQICLIICL